MRISSQQQHFLSSYWHDKNENCKVFLFGSRVDDHKKGGDIDIMLLSDIKIHHSEIYKMKLAFFNLFGNQKIDVVSFENNDQSAFKNHILNYAQIL